MADLTVLEKMLLGTVRNSFSKEGEGEEAEGEAWGKESKKTSKITEGYDGVKEKAIERP